MKEITFFQYKDEHPSIPFLYIYMCDIITQTISDLLKSHQDYIISLLLCQLSDVRCLESKGLGQFF